MNELEPGLTVELVPAERQELLILLSPLSWEEWALPSVGAAWGGEGGRRARLDIAVDVRA